MIAYISIRWYTIYADGRTERQKKKDRNRKMKKEQYYRSLDHALSIANLYDFTPHEFYHMLDGIMLCAQHDCGITQENYVEILTYKEKIAEEIGK